MGRQIGEKLSESIETLWNHYMEFYDTKDTSKFWKPLALNNTKTVEQYAPLSYQEIIGYGKSVLSFEEMLMFSFQWDFDVLLDANPYTRTGRCTSFAANDFVTKDGKLISGQTDDENIESQLNGT
eukprot:UN26223